MRFENPRDYRDHIVGRFCHDFTEKWNTGQEEHGGELQRKPGMEKHMLAEALDFVAYAYVAVDQKELTAALLRDAIRRHSWDCVQAALNVLETGNAEGEHVEDR